jgi:hypothetical protein
MDDFLYAGSENRDRAQSLAALGTDVASTDF